MASYLFGFTRARSQLSGHVQVRKDETTVTSDPDNETNFIETIGSAVDMLLSNRTDDARRLLAPERPPGTPASFRKAPSYTVQARVFVRDHFTCRYCGRRTLFVPVLRAISSIVPDVLPYHPHWKMSDCHIAYWQYAASIDHVVPIARGGDATSDDNLVTSCYMCNSIKQNWLLDELHWQLLPISGERWDGFSSRLPELCGAAKLTDVPYFAQWLRAIAQARKT